MMDDVIYETISYFSITSIALTIPDSNNDTILLNFQTFWNSTQVIFFSNSIQRENDQLNKHRFSDKKEVSL